MRRLVWANAVASAMVLVVASFAFAGGSSESSAPSAQSGTTTVHFWSYTTGEEEKIFQNAIKSFNASHSKVHVVPTFGVDNQKFLTAVAGGSPPDAADVNGGGELAAWAVKGALTDLNPYIKATNLPLDTFIPATLAYVRYKGKYYAMPGAFDGLFLYYNKSIFSRAGLTPPKTVVQLDTIAAKLTEESNGKIQQLGFSPTGGISGDDGLMVWAYQYGGHWWNSKTQSITPTLPGNIEALKWEVGYYKKYGVEALNNFNQASYGSGALGSDPFAFGKVAMEAGGEWLNKFLRTYAPKIQFGEVPLPVVHAGAKPRMFVAEDMWVIPSTAKRKKAGWQFLDWIEQPSVYGPIANNMVNLPQFKKLYTDMSWAGPSLKINVELQKKYDTIPSPNFPGFVKYSSLIVNAEQQATNLKMSPEAALAQIKSEMSQ